MNIMVYDVQADSGGAATVLEYFYNLHKQDKRNHYYYMLSVYHLDDTDNITVVNIPKVKKSWFHRLFFDYIGVRKYLYRFNINEVISLQNTIVPCFRGRQIVYEHNALPFCEYKFLLRENKKMWIYQNVIGRFMINSVKKADKVIVQTAWMKEAICKVTSVFPEKIEIQFPKIQIPKGYKYSKQKSVQFFYPANSAPFKNHNIILEACQILNEKGIKNYFIVFTLNGNETRHISEIYNAAKMAEIDIKWIGSIPRLEVFELYSKSILLFPSYIETIGLPIYEAAQVGCPMLLSDCSFSRDVTKEYEDVHFFKYDDPVELANLMYNMIIREGEEK